MRDAPNIGLRCSSARSSDTTKGVGSFQQQDGSVFSSSRFVPMPMSTWNFRIFPCCCTPLFVQGPLRGGGRWRPCRSLFLSRRQRASLAAGPGCRLKLPDAKQHSAFSAKSDGAGWTQRRSRWSKWGGEALSLLRKAHLTNAYATTMEVDGMIGAVGS